jgi:hypothetical protein
MHFDGYEVFYSGKERRLEAGIAQARSESARKSMLEIMLKNERMLKACFVSSQSKLIIILLVPWRLRQTSNERLFLILI